MSWLFGSKKTKTAVVTSPSADNSNKIEVNEEDDFLVVNKQPTQGPSTQDLMPPMYPSLSNGMNGINLTTSTTSAANHQIAVISPLQGVPFQLSNNLRMATGKWSSDLATLQAQAFVNSVDSRTYDYDFNIERSVACEF